MKRLLAVILTAAILLFTGVLSDLAGIRWRKLSFDSVLRVSAKAATVVNSGKCGAGDSNVKWTLDSAGALTISGSGKMKDYYPQTVPWYSSLSSVRTVVIMQGVTNVGQYAFNGCGELTSVMIPDSVTSIGYSAFCKCSELASVTIGKRVTSIGEKAFYNCYRLTTVTIPDSVTSIGIEAFRDCSGLTAVTIPDKVTSVGESAFCGCGKLSSVTIGNSVRNIGDYAFFYCRSLTSVTIPDSVTSIGDAAFSDCSELTTATIGNGVKNIGYHMFSNCGKLSSVTIGKSVTSIGESAFERCSALTSAMLPDSVTSIGNSAFYGCGLMSVAIPDSVKSIGGGAFSYCRSLTSVTIGNNVTSIGKTAFNNCARLKAVIIGNSVTSIGDSAFSYCSGLTKVTIPDSVTGVGDAAFKGCGNLSKVYYTGSETKWNAISIGSDNDPLLNADRQFHYALLTVSYYANGGSDEPADQTKEKGKTLTLSATKPKKSYRIFYNANGGNLTTSLKTVSCTFKSWNTKQDGSGTSYAPGANYTKDANATLYAQWTDPTAGTLDRPARSGYTFVGWFTAANGGTEITKDSTITKTQTIYAHWTNKYTVNYDANGGTGAPSAQIKKNGTMLMLSAVTPSKILKITYDANGGSVSPAFQSVSCTFKNWNTARDGTGTSYAPGKYYTANADLTLYAQWKEPTAGMLATPTRSGYTFNGWYTAVSGGTKITSDTTIPADTTLYAHWTVAPKNSYTVSYNANGGSGAPATQTKTEGQALTISSAKPTKTFTITYNANGGSVSPASKSVNCTFKNWNTKQDGTGASYAPGASYTNDANVTLYAQWANPTAGTLATPARSGYTFSGWYTAASGGTKVTASSTVTKSQTLYAHWTAVPKNSYTVSYDVNGGVGTPSTQTKTEGKALTLSSMTPTKSYTIYYNSNGGSVSPASKSVSCEFRSWNTKQDGSGTGYAPGAGYTKDADVTLYAQWTTPTAGTLPTPTRSGYTFDGWYTAASGGTKVTSSSAITKSQTLYAHWAGARNIYNLGEETYSFENFGDSDSPYGHCFGMSVTSSGYYLGLLDQSRLGTAPLYSYTRTETVKAPICRYQGIQGSYSNRAIVAGGSTYLTNRSDIASDWAAAVDYVKDHRYDNKGSLQIGFRMGGGGHAINFLRYERVNGQDRIYAYDNNFPERETYFYQNAAGQVYQAPMQTFPGAIECFALRDVNLYFELAGTFDASRVIYVAKDAAVIQGLTYTCMEGVVSGPEYVMYEIPEGLDSVIVIPNRSNADFIYLGKEYSFGEEIEDTYGALTMASKDDYGASTVSFEIKAGRAEIENRGDVDGDGKISSGDARLALRASVKLENYPAGSAQFAASDVNRDGKISPDDARTILRVSVRLESFR